MKTSSSGPTFSQFSVCGPMAAKSSPAPPALLLPSAVEARTKRKPGPRGVGRLLRSSPMRRANRGWLMLLQLLPQ